MRYATAAAFRTALEARLRTQAAGEATALVRLRKLVVFERLLARLLAVAPDRWILKGGVALDFRFGDKARITVDLDLARQDREEHAANDLAGAQAVDMGDFFTFTIEKASILRPGEGAAVRYRVMARLDDRRFETVVVDVGFENPTILPVDRLRGPVLLEFAGIPVIEKSRYCHCRSMWRRNSTPTPSDAMATGRTRE